MTFESIETKGAALSSARQSEIRNPKSAIAGVRLRRALLWLALVLLVSTLVALWVGYQRIGFTALRTDERMRLIFFELRLPRVLMAGVVGASLGVVGAALQAMFRNPLAEPLTLGVSGGGALGASVAIAFGAGTRVAGLPVVFVAAFAGACASVVVVYRLARTGATVLPGALLLAGVVMNTVAAAGVVIIQYFADYSRALQILRWTIGSLDVVGFDLIWRMLLFLVPGWALLLYLARDLHLLAVDEETAQSLGVNVRRSERLVYVAASLIVGVTVAVGGTIGFVGLIVPHAVRLVFGEDVRIVLPCSFVLGAAFLMLADAAARTVLGAGELPVGAITALAGGPVFLWLLRRQQRYTTM
ncbi:MAG TPA: iron ABC transporter permease [Pyrinomonadaceae bacterium]|jgi:iron complex transport system permease protein|nr:iron ABC transporter permease [Pyrinomonadaceae bacterium]